jgi:hypothetical protein
MSYTSKEEADRKVIDIKKGDILDYYLNNVTSFKTMNENDRKYFNVSPLRWSNTTPIPNGEVVRMYTDVLGCKRDRVINTMFL